MNKIYIDSRFKLPSSSSTSNFSIELNNTVEIEAGTNCYLSNVLIPNTWYTIEDNNDKLYIRIIRHINFTSSDYIITLTHKNYDLTTLRDELELKLDQLGVSFTVVFTPTSGTLAIMCNDNNVSWYLFTTEELKTNVNNTWNGYYYPTNNSQSCNEMLRNSTGTSGEYRGTNVFLSGFVDILNHHSVYICSSLVANDSLGSRGETNIFKKVIVNANYGELISDNMYHDHDYTTLSKSSLKILDFSLRDVYGNEIDLHGSHIYFTLLFDRSKV